METTIDRGTMKGLHRADVGWEAGGYQINQLLRVEGWVGPVGGGGGRHILTVD